VVADIGGGSGGPEDELASVGGALLLSDGSIVVANAERELRYYDPRGGYRSKVGREGEGPGEFRFLYWIGLSEDSVVAYDLDLRRISTFDAAGRYAGSVRLPSAIRGSFPYPVGVLHDGSLLFLDHTAPRPGMRTGVTRDPTRLYRWDRRDGGGVELGVFPLWDVLADGVAMVAPFSPKAYFTPTPDGFVFAFSDSGRAYGFNRDGVQVGSAAWSAVPLRSSPGSHRTA